MSSSLNMATQTTSVTGQGYQVLLENSSDQNTISSLPELVKILYDFLGGPGETDLKLRVKETLIHTKDVKKVLKGHRAVYDPEKGILVVKGMTKPLHDAVFRLAYRFLAEAPWNGFIDHELSRRLSLSVQSEMLAGKISDISRKAQAWTKYPDASYLFEDPKTDETTPTVIFEIGFTESYQDLLSDMWQWITKSHGAVRLVILVNIVEDIHLRKSYQQTPGSENRVTTLLNEFGNIKGKAAHQRAENNSEEAETEEEIELDADMYNSIKELVVTEDWVGPITVDLEFWEAAPLGPQQRGTRLRVIPHQGTRNAPPIYISDLIPSKYHNTIPNFDPSRTAFLEIDTLQRYLVAGHKKLAVNRAIRYLRPRP